MEVQIETAINDAVSQANQPEDLATKIIAWMKALTTGNESIDDRLSVSNRTAVLFDAVELKNGEDE